MTEPTDPLVEMWTSPNLINNDAIEDMDTETLERVWEILKDI